MRTAIRGSRGAAAWICLLASVSWAWGQEDWKWPEKAENLQSLPKDFPPQRLRAVMLGFSRALGVDCSHCHVGKKDEPLGSYDFPSDENPRKKTARAMLEMLGSINGHLKKIEPSGPKRVNMWCHTCHRGRPRPLTLEEDLAEALNAGGVEAAISRYRQLREEFYGQGAYDFGESSLNSFGSSLLRDGNLAGAIAVFRLNAEQFPQSAEAYDSLAEAYQKADQPELALVYCLKSLELNPDGALALERLRQLRALQR